MKYTNPAIMKIYEDHDFQERALTASLRPEQVNPAEYDAIYFTGAMALCGIFQTIRHFKQ